MVKNNLHVPRCAVLLAAYNGMAHIEEQVVTILGQSSVQVTLFISVDLSTDGTFEWLVQLARSEPRIQLLPYGEHFGGAAKNFFRLIKDIDLSGFDYCAFADQDDHWFKDKLERAIGILNKHQCYGYSSNVTAFWPDGKKRLIKKSQSQKSYDFFFEAAGPGCTYVMKAEFLGELRQYMLSHWDRLQAVWLHDWFCYAFARARGYPWFIDASPSMLYRQHENNQVGVNKGLKAHWARFKVIQEGKWFKQVLLIADLIGLKDHDFIKQWSKLSKFDLMHLSFYATQCRRSKCDQFLFFCICWLVAFIPVGTKE